jgi:two-component system, NtrC family, C4-dicarboxylate transport sensor histidine kinase DctB
MLRTRLKQGGLFACALGAVGISMFVSQHVWRENGLRALQAVNEPRVQLVANAIKAEISRQDHLPVVLSLDPDVRSALEPTDDAATRAARLDRLDRKLARLSREADARAMFVIGADGIVVASDDWNAPETLVGRNLASHPIFREAVASSKSSYLGIETSTNRVRYYLAEAIRDTALLGVSVVRIEFDTLEAAWQRAGERVLVADKDGVAFLASDPDYKFRSLGPLEPSAQPERAASRYQGVQLAPIQGEVLERRGSDLLVRITTPEADIVRLSQTTALTDYGWTIHRLASLAVVNEDQRDGAIIGGSLSTLIIILALYVAERHRAFVAASKSGEELKRQVAERTHELSESNSSLQTEIEERRRTEVRLRAAQNELVQAGKLAALGQMSAAIAHEINQPLAAIRTFMASTRIFAQRGDLAKIVGNLDLITDLAERMAAITGHLKTFARKSEPGHREPVLVDRAVERALFLLQGQIKSAGVRIEIDVDRDLWVMGHAVQLEQVILNIVRNALDAVADLKSPLVRIEARASAETVCIAIADSGPGIPADRIDRIFDPFFTTKPVGKGLGLGLSISYGIVQDFGGEIHARNRPDGGAELTVELPRHRRAATGVETAIHA